MPRIPSLLLIFSLFACEEAPVDDFQQPCGPPQLWSREDVNLDWYYRRTVVDSEGPFEGVQDLRRAQMRLDGDLIVDVDGVEVARWPIREIDVTCDNGTLVTTESAGGGYFELERTPSGVGMLSARAGWSATFSPSEVDDTRQLPGYLEVTEVGELALEPSACTDFVQRIPTSQDPVDCLSTVRLRHSFKPVDGGFVPRPISDRFGAHEHAGFAEKLQGPPIFHLDANAPEFVVQAAAQVAREIQQAIPGFEIRPNSCSAEGIARAIEARPSLEAMVAPDMMARCKAFEAAAPDIFTYQRVGDVRFNTIVLRPTGGTEWGLHASRAVDATTGAIVAADLILSGPYLDQVVGAVLAHATDGDDAAEVLQAVGEARAQALAAELLPDVASRIPETAPDRTLAAFEAVEDAISGSGTERLADDRRVPILLIGPSWTGGGSAPFELIQYGGLSKRIELILDLEGRQRAATLIDAGYAFMDRYEHPGHAAVSATLAGMAAEEGERLLRANLTTHHLLSGLLQSMGLTVNPAGTYDAANHASDFASSSVLDLLPAEHRHRATKLGPYDLAALAALYSDVEPSEPLTFCDLQTALTEPTISCAIDDWGTNAREVVAHAYGRWLGHYYYSQLTGGDLSFDGVGATRPAIEVFWRASIAAQTAWTESALDPAFAGSEAARDLVTAAVHGANFAAELTSIPEPGRRCPWPGASNPQVFIPAEFLADSCDPSVAVDSATAIAEEQIEPPLGIVRDATVGRPAMGEPWDRVGSAFDRANAQWAVLLAFPSQQPAFTTRVALADVVPELGDLFEIMATRSPFFLSISDAEQLGMYWCRDASSPTEVFRGQGEQRRIIDASTGGLAGAPDDCTQAAVIYPTTEAERIENALFFKQTMHVGAPMAIYNVGVDDGAIDWTTYDPTELCSFTDELGNEFRGIYADSPAACSMIDATQDAFDSAQDNSPIFRDFYEAQRELLVGAHLLYALFVNQR